jgi:hypothetical protein
VPPLSPVNKLLTTANWRPNDEPTIYRRGVTNLRRDADVDVTAYVAKTAAGVHERLAEVSSTVRRSVDEEIPSCGETRGYGDNDRRSV